MSFEIKNKRILILSPCDWSDFQVSKHHYAKELAKRNNDVLFLEWPTFSSTKKKAYFTLNFYSHVGIRVDRLLPRVRIPRTKDIIVYDIDTNSLTYFYSFDRQTRLYNHKQIVGFIYSTSDLNANKISSILDTYYLIKIKH